MAAGRRGVGAARYYSRGTRTTVRTAPHVNATSRRLSLWAELRQGDQLQVAVPISEKGDSVPNTGGGLLFYKFARVLLLIGGQVEKHCLWPVARRALECEHLNQARLRRLTLHQPHIDTARFTVGARQQLQLRLHCACPPQALHLKKSK
jgi:hypothetical protein